MLFSLKAMSVLAFKIVTIISVGHYPLLQFEREEYQQYLFQLLCPASDAAPSKLQTNYTDAITKAHEGDYKTAQKILGDGLRENSKDPWAQKFLLENLCWLDLFFEQWDALSVSADILLIEDAFNPTGLYARVLRSHRAGDDASALLDLKQLTEADLSPSLAYQARVLSNDIAAKTAPASSTKIAPEPSHDFLTTDDPWRYIKYSAFKTAADQDWTFELFRDWNVKNYSDFEERIKNLYQDRSNQGLSKKDFPWIMHLFFGHFMTYKAVLASSGRTLDESFARKEYDCTELTDALGRGLNALGIPAVEISYADTPSTRHIFVAYKINGLWGYASPLSFSEPQYKNLSDVCDQWSWDVSEGDFDVHFWDTTISAFIVQ